MASKEERNKRLDALLEASDNWTNKQIKYLEDKVTMTKLILKKRTGSERLNTVASNLAKEVVIESLDQFLTGD